LNSSTVKPASPMIQAEAGEEVIILRRKTSVARLTAIPKAKKARARDA
jgi:antitoxin (DNA-binding transcriptional repressor) of toxin-antitoxin stability system